MTGLEVILKKLNSITDKPWVVKGGNRSNPYEYSYYKLSGYEYRLELYIHSKDLRQIDSLVSKLQSIEDFGDYPRLDPSLSITNYGGGSFSKDTLITQVLYYTVIDYTRK